MKMTIELAQVGACSERACGFNAEGNCHSTAVTIGDGDEPRCDTYMRSPTRRRNTATIAGVGACKVSTCRFNADFECTANVISVVHQMPTPMCATFES